MRLTAAASCLLILSLSAGSASAELGIASAHPGDQGLGADPRVVFFEDFERDAVTDLSARWEDVKNPDNLSLVSDAPPGSAGGRSLRIVSHADADTGGHLYTRLPGPQQRLYLRYYVKYASGGTYHHAGAWLGGYNPPTSWPQGGAGQRPVGNERFTVGFEPAGPELRWDFYAYWMRMRADGSGAFWGNTFVNDASLRVLPDRWTCIEVMIELNDPVDAPTGKLAAWIDGTRVAHLGPGFPIGTWSGGGFTPGTEGDSFEGFQWRNDPALAINFLWFQLYTTDVPRGTMWFDQVVAATEYIGPISRPAARVPEPPILLED
jgi:hypothetical protein